MGFLSLIIALLLEQVRPLQNNNPAYGSVRGVAASIERNFNAGEKQQGMLAWLLLVIPLTVGTWLIFYLLVRAHPFLGLGWNVLVLYFTMGFRQFSHYYTDIQEALANNDLAEARRLLTQWKSARDEKFSAAELSVSDVCRLSIEEALIASHRHVFGVLFWFVLLPGPSGAVLYRLTNYLARHWSHPVSTIIAGAENKPERFGQFARQMFAWIDWVPVRLSAIGFAIVGNFEDAIFCWRHHAQQWSDPFRGVLLSAGAGALGVRLGDAQSFPSMMATTPAMAYADTGAATDLPRDEPAPDDTSEAQPEAMPGVEASPAAMRSAVGLVWRSMVLWLILLLLLSVAGLLG